MGTGREKATLSEPLFVSQKKLESWVDKGEVSFDDNVLTILAKNASYTLEPAVKVQSMLDGQDVHGLLDKVWTVTQLERIGAEHFQDSVILGDAAYQCEEGFVGTQHSAQASAPAPMEAVPVPAPVAAPPEPSQPLEQPIPVPEEAAAGGEEADMDLLQDFLLKNL